MLIEQRALQDQLSQLKERSLNDKQYAVDLYQEKTDNFAQRFRQLTHKNENDLKVIRVQYEQFQGESRGELEAMEQQLSYCKKAIKSLDKRRITESQAFQSDIQSVKKRVINFERYIKRLKKHVDEEKTTELITELENTEVA